MVTRCFNTSGFVWDATTQRVITCHSVWQDYLKEHRDTEKYRREGCPLYDKLALVVGNSIAMGIASITPIDLGNELLRESIPIPLDELEDVNVVRETPSPFISGNESTVEQSQRSNLSSSSRRRPRSALSTDDIGRYIDVVKEIARALKDVIKPKEGDVERDWVKALRAILDLSDNVKYCASEWLDMPSKKEDTISAIAIDVYHVLVGLMILNSRGFLSTTKTILVEEQFAYFLLTIDQQQSYSVTTEMFDRSNWTISRYFYKVLGVILKLHFDYVKRPLERTHLKILNSSTFYPYFKDCIGAIDGTHIKGSTADSRFLAPYRGTRHHLQEFGDNIPRNEKELFNRRHSCLWYTIEGTFGALKVRFQMLKGAYPFSFKIQKKIVIACCILHNYIREDDYNDRFELEDDDSGDELGGGSDGVQLGAMDDVDNIDSDGLVKRIAN
ncbi:uncharacterized protein [Aristolochia californica]|uniref:uncharacterized protein n=1 Tax=Aristolochia californica TaxID=171875 RepID=UPI0035DF4B7E